MNGTLFISAASTNRCPHVLIERASGVRVAALNASSVTVPAASRTAATSTGDIARRPSLIHQNEQPQIAPSKTNHTCHPIRRACGGLVMGSGGRLRGACTTSPRLPMPGDSRHGGSRGGSCGKTMQPGRGGSWTSIARRASPGPTWWVGGPERTCACYRARPCTARPILPSSRRQWEIQWAHCVASVSPRSPMHWIEVIAARRRGKVRALSTRRRNRMKKARGDVHLLHVASSKRLAEPDEVT